MDSARKTVLTGQTVQWIKNVQCCADSVTAKLKQTNKGRANGLSHSPQTALSLSLSSFLSLPLSVSHLMATEQGQCPELGALQQGKWLLAHCSQKSIPSED